MFEYKRTHNLGKLNKSNIGEKVTLSGWVHRRRDHGRLIFIDLRDRFGITQIVFDPKISNASKKSHEEANRLRSEWVISIKGEVFHRGEGLENPNLATGEIEVKVEKIQILSPSKTPPFSVCDERIEVNEELRLKYRFLDIRRGDISKKLEVRHKALFSTRNFLDSLGFLEIATPILAKSTPEGARDYLVPSRVYPGNFYALPQSPQIFKQILMISGMDRYFQIAQCFRDEDLRADRQPEFTQIDIEMSFETLEDFFPIIEKLMKTIFEKCLNVDIPTPFPRMTHKDAMEKYGTDKPDLRFEMELVRIDDIAEKSNFSILKEQLKQGSIVKALCVKKGAKLSRREIDDLIAFVGPLGMQGLAWMKKTEEGFSSSIVKFFGEKELKEIEKRLSVEEDDLVLIGAASEDILNMSMDHLRRHIAKKLGLIPKDTYKFTWVTDFPLFRWDFKTNEMKTEHHPFTSPNFEDKEFLQDKDNIEDLLKVRSIAYDLVLNGYEIGSGSQRIFNSALQKQIFEILKLTEHDINERFGFFVKALQYGTPPHLGIALGFDRIVMILTDTENIRDVIAFPKTQKASDLMMEAPSQPEKAQLKELEIETEHKEISWT